MAQDRHLVYSTGHGRVTGQTGKHREQAEHQAGGQGVRISREKKGRGGKTVCVISGLTLPQCELKGLLKELKCSLGTGGAMKHGCIEIQGDHRDKLLSLLGARGIRARAGGG